MELKTFTNIIKNQYQSLSAFFSSTASTDSEIDNPGVLGSTEDSHKLSKAIARNRQTAQYPTEFIEKAQDMLDKGMWSEYLELLQHNYQPPVKQQKQWSKIVISEIEKEKDKPSAGYEVYDPNSSNNKLVLELIEKKYDFSPTELWGFFSTYATLSGYNTPYILKQKFENEIDIHLPLLLDNIHQDLKKETYHIEFVENSIGSTCVENKVRELNLNLKKLLQIWALSDEGKKINSEPIFDTLEKFEKSLTNVYAHEIQEHKYYYPMNIFIENVSKLKHKVLGRLRTTTEKRAEIEDMKEFLKNQNIESDLLNNTQELRLQTIKKTEHLPTHIQELVDKISGVYKTVSRYTNNNLNTDTNPTSNNPEIAFETKNVITQSVPQLLAAYLAFPESYRQTFKNDKGETPEALLVVGLQQQLDILNNFERAILLEKSQKIEVLNTYGHNKKMALSQ